MKRFMKACAFAVLCFAWYAQAQQVPATQDELQYFRFMLMNLASLDHGTKAINMFEASLRPQFGLNDQEAATLHAAAQALKIRLIQLRESARRVASGKTSLSAADWA